MFLSFSLSFFFLSFFLSFFDEGDELITTCKYNTMDRDEPVVVRNNLTISS